MNVVDIIIVLPVLYGAWIGFRKGFVIEVATLLAFVLGIWAGVHFSDFAVGIIEDQIDISNRSLLPVIAFALVFLAVGALVFFAGKAVEKLVDITALAPINKLAGALLGTVKYLLILSVGLVTLEAYDARSEFIPKDMKQGSMLYEPVKSLSTRLLPALANSELMEAVEGSPSMIEDFKFLIQED